MNGITHFAIKYRLFVCIAFLAITVFFGMQIPKEELYPGIKNMLPDSFPLRTAINRIEELFGGSNECVDEGRILGQRIVTVLDRDSMEQLAARVLVEENNLYFRVIEEYGHACC